MVNPQSFVLGILFIVIGIPVISSTIINLVHGPKEVRKDRKRKYREEKQDRSDEDSRMLEEIYHGLSDLGKRVKNLETILDSQGDENE
jgi:hypothetical protein